MNDVTTATIADSLPMARLIQPAVRGHRAAGAGEEGAVDPYAAAAWESDDGGGAEEEVAASAGGVASPGGVVSAGGATPEEPVNPDGGADPDAVGAALNVGAATSGIAPHGPAHAELVMQSSSDAGVPQGLVDDMIARRA